MMHSAFSPPTMGISCTPDEKRYEQSASVYEKDPSPPAESGLD
jgi:hypothetical protein